MLRCIALAVLILGNAAELACGQTSLVAHVDSSQVVNNSSASTATGRLSLELSADQSQLAYQFQLVGLNLEPLADGRTDANDVVGIHLHLHVQDLVGPHILNIFGFPGEDDADLQVDFANNSLTGVYDMSDGIDPATGEPFFQDDPLATKLIGDWTDELLDGELYIAVHTRERSTAAPPGVAIRGNIFVVPEPPSVLMLVAVLIVVGRGLRSRKVEQVLT